MSRARAVDFSRMCQKILCNLEQAYVDEFKRVWENDPYKDEPTKKYLFLLPKPRNANLRGSGKGGMILMDAAKTPTLVAVNDSSL